MPVGFESINDFGSVIIDADYYTQAFLAKGSQTLSQEYGQTTGPLPYFTDAWRHPDASIGGGYIGGTDVHLIAFRARDSARPVGILDCTTTGDGSGAILSTAVQFVGFSDTATAPIVDWWTFGKPATASNVGLEIFRSDGNRVYHSDHKPVNVAAAIQNASTMTAIDAGSTGDYAISVGFPMEGIRSGSPTDQGSGVWAWLATRYLWGSPGSTGFAAPVTKPTARPTANFFPTGFSEGNVPHNMVLVNVAGL